MSDFKIINPYTQKILQKITFDSPEKIKQICSAADEGKKIAANIPAFRRSEILLKLTDLLIEQKETLARKITDEMGKTIKDSHAELDRSIITVRMAAFEAANFHGEALDVDAVPPGVQKTAIVRPAPVGVVLAITPFNFPVNLALHKIAPAFAAGNVIIFKPAPQCAISAQFLYELCLKAGFPKEIFYFLLPSNENMSFAICDPNVNCINFTGGTAVAEQIVRVAGMKKLIFELGGNDALIVTPSGEIERAVHAAVAHRFGMGGQRCTASKRMYIHRSRYAEFIERLQEKAQALLVGDPLEEDVFLGPLVSVAAAELAERRVNGALKNGAKALVGGKRDGALFFPTLLIDTPETAELITEETFAPVACPLPYDTDEELAARINRSPYGLQCGIFTDSLTQAKYFSREIEVGTLILNEGSGFRADHLPFGGVKKSGIGREGVRYAMREMSILKTLIF